MGIIGTPADLNLRPGEEVDIEIADSVRSTKGIIKLFPAIARDIADSDKCTFLEEGMLEDLAFRTESLRRFEYLHLSFY